ncbi:ACT domain-containing protein ACR10-like [Senna tora]|uniref:ACT domain-containing protein ACR10-like n=1 Tax=Senna tora TaxID=362788 RepID=A0A834TR27_9FABA|nr:ACT domain-containing protein ACR10-like [Senna tora]KAF7826774.1 ACT domain-containing protein ACR10-like [Senna tora]
MVTDVTEVLCELELTIKKAKVSTTPDGKVMDLFFITDTRLDILNIILEQC